MTNPQPSIRSLAFVKIIVYTKGEDYIDYFQGSYKTKEDFQKMLMIDLQIADIDHIEFYYISNEGAEIRFVIRKISNNKEWYDWVVYYLADRQFIFGCNRSEFVETLERLIKVKLHLN
jgi:hypothetical protein